MKKLIPFVFLAAVVLVVSAAKYGDTVTTPMVAGLSSTIKNFMFAADAAAARSVLGITESTTNSVLPVANGGTSGTNDITARHGLGIQAKIGVTSADGTVTNTFTTVFSSTPCIVQLPFNQDAIQTNTVRSITVSNYVADFGSAGVTFYYIAIKRDNP